MSAICCTRCQKAPCVCDTAPQPEVLPRKTNAIMEVLETLESELLDRIATLEKLTDKLANENGALQRATEHPGLATVVHESLEGMREKRIATLEAQLAEAQRTAKSQRIADIMPSASHRIQRSQRLAYIRQLEETNAKLRDELAEAQERLAMAVEALEQHGQHFISCPQDKRRPWNDKRKPCSCGLDDALAATSEAVAQHTASVERRGAAKAQSRLDQIHAIVTRLLAEPGSHTEALIEVATICEGGEVVRLEGA